MRCALLAVLALQLPLTAAAGELAAPTAADERLMDRMQLDSSVVTGNRELPKVMSIVPWKQAEPPTGPDRPMGSLIEEVLSPVDHAEFRREITYFRDLTSQSPVTGVDSLRSSGADSPRPADPTSSPGASEQ